MENLLLLDTTLRDGGLGLEDAYINGFSNKSFSKQQILSIRNSLIKAKIDVIELGSIEISTEDKTRFGIYQDVQSISSLIPENHEKSMFVALYRGPDTPIDKIPNHNESLVDGVRVIIRYSELIKSLEFCQALSKKGYKVFVQPMLTKRYSESELDTLISYSNNMKAYALYFVDSYGYMDSDDVDYFFNRYNKGLDSQIKIGFHAHNNMNLAFSNAKEFISIAKTNAGRSVILDSCLCGMGQGAGNLQTEIITDFLNKLGKSYSYDYILDGCEELENFNPKTLWGYSMTRLLPAIHKAAYKYSIVMREKYHMSYRDIDFVFAHMDNFLKQRYTKENVEKVIGQYKPNYLEQK